MSMTLIQIGSTDLTAYADIQNFNINREDVYESWTDGNWIDHREIVRTRIRGAFQLGFRTSASWTAFLALMSSEQNAAGFFPVTVYVQNTGSTETIDAFLDITGSAKWDWVNERFWRTISVTLTER